MGKYDEYVIQPPLMRMTVNEDGRQVFNGFMANKGLHGCKFTMGYQIVTKPFIGDNPQHRHNFQEFLAWYGTNPDDPFEFDAEVELFMGEEQERYLHAILENVGFTDSLINRTLEFNRPGSKVKPEKLTVKPVLEEMLRKYTPLLDEKHITCTLDGDASLTADRAGLETILENLIANAVKYTPEGGQIRASADRKRIVLSNSVSGQIDVRHLKQPFVRGDAARSNPDGSGLGLALADRAALAAGWRLRLSCKDGLFRAEIRF